MFDPKALFPIVKASVKKGSDEQIMGALTKLAEAHPDLTPQQALAALSAYAQKQTGQMPAKPGGLSQYLSKGGQQ